MCSDICEKNMAILTCVICQFVGVPDQLKPEVVFVCPVRKRVPTAKIPTDRLERNVPSNTTMEFRVRSGGWEGSEI